jgi:hypothetical protein
MIPRHAMGLPVLRALSLVYVLVATTPAPRLGVNFARFPTRISLPRIGDRVGQCIVLFEACSAFTSHYGPYTCWITLRDPLHQRLQPVRYIPDCSDCFRPERSSRVGFAPTGKAPPYHGARQYRTFVYFFIADCGAKAPQQPELSVRTIITYADRQPQSTHDC